MKSKTFVTWLGIAIGLAGAALLAAPTAVASPTPNDYNPGEIYNDTYNNFTTALNVTANVSERMEFYLDCGVPDYDYMYVWLPAGQDLAINIETDQNISFRFAAVLRSPEHFPLVVKELRPQVGINIYSVWYNTTTRIDGQYFLTIDGPSCFTPANFYNVTWFASATAAVSDGDDSLASATDIGTGLSATGNLTETSDQADFFKVTAGFTSPTFQYLQITSYSFELGTDFDLELYNSSGVLMEYPQIVPGTDPNTTANFLFTQGFRFPTPGTYYLRLWSTGFSGNWSLSFVVQEFTPSPNIDFGNATVVTDNFVKSNDALNYSFEIAHYYKIFIGSPRTLWVDAWSNQIDIQVQMVNETFTGSHLQQRLSRHFFDSNANPKDHEFFNYTATAGQLANSTGWFFIIVRMDSDIPPNGVYTVNIWLNDGPVGLNVSRTLTEDTPLASFNASLLFTDLDCTLNAADPDCGLNVTLLSGSQANLSYDFSAAPLLTVTPAANWYGFECRRFHASDAKDLTANGTLCITVTPVNDAPVVVSPPAPLVKDMTEDLSLSAVLISSWFSDVDGDPLTFTVSGNDNISVTITQASGSADFVPEPNFHGSNNLTFCAADPSNASVCWTVEFRVGAVNDPPEPRGALPQVNITEDQFQVMNLNTVLIYGVIGPAFTDIDGDPLTYKIYNTEAELTVTVLGPVLTITPGPNAAGIFFFEVSALDGNGGESAKSAVRVVVTGVNDAPVISVFTPPANPTVPEGNSATFTVTATDVDGDSLTYQWFVNAVGVNNAIFPNYTATTLQTAEGNRSVIVKVVASDGHGGSAEHEWTLFIQNVNQAPGSLTITSPTKTTYTTDDEITFSATAVDPDNDTLTWTWYSDKLGPPIGTQQTFTSKLPAGTNHIRLDVSDGRSVTQTNMTILVQPPAAPPNGGAGTLVIVAVVAIAAAGAGAFLMMRRKSNK